MVITALLLLVILAQMLLTAFVLRQAGRERADLLQRIQAPQAAVIAHATANLPPDPPELPYDDDIAFHKSREELADRLAAFGATYPSES